jgi:hypothetical protein
MDKIVKLPRLSKKRSGPGGAKSLQRPPREAAEDAVRTLIRWLGDDPDREGLVGTPARVVRAYEVRGFCGSFSLVGKVRHVKPVGAAARAERPATGRHTKK